MQDYCINEFSAGSGGTFFGKAREGKLRDEEEVFVICHGGIHGADDSP